MPDDKQIPNPLDEQGVLAQGQQPAPPLPGAVAGDNAANQVPQDADLAEAPVPAAAAVNLQEAAEEGAVGGVILDEDSASDISGGELDHDLDLVSLQEQIDSLRAAIDGIESQQDEFEDKALKGASSLKLQIDSLRRQLDAFQKQFDQLVDIVTRMSDQAGKSTEPLKKQLDELQGQFDALQKQSGATLGKASWFSGIGGKTSMESERLKKRLDMLQGQFDALQSQCDALKVVLGSESAVESGVQEKARD